MGFPENLTDWRTIRPQSVSGFGGTLQSSSSRGNKSGKIIYVFYEPNNRFVLAFPILNPQSKNENYVEGVMVFMVDSFPTQKVIPEPNPEYCWKKSVDFSLWNRHHGYAIRRLFCPRSI